MSAGRIMTCRKHQRRIKIRPTLAARLRPTACFGVLDFLLTSPRPIRRIPIRGSVAMQIDTIEPAKTAMIVVDMQNDFVAAGAPIEVSAARAMVPKLAEALK